MSCPNTAFQPDFFNNAAAIAVVLLFTKVVTHRLRKVRRMRWVDWLHGLAVMGSVVAIGASLWATEKCSTVDLADRVAWIGLGVAGFALLFDVGLEDLKWNWLSRLATPRSPDESTATANSPKF